jgi:nitrate/nitrite transporter NarK
LLESIYGFSQVDAGRTTAVVSIIATVMSPFVGIWIDKFGKHTLVVCVGNLLLIVAFILFYFEVAVSAPIVLLGLSSSLTPAAIWVSCKDTITDGGSQVLW